MFSEIQKMIDICIEYKQGKFEIDTFIKHLERIYLPDECKYTLAIDQHNGANRLDSIRFSYKGDNLINHAHAVANELIAESVIEQKRLENDKPYAEEKLRA